MKSRTNTRGSCYNRVFFLVLCSIIPSGVYFSPAQEPRIVAPSGYFSGTPLSVVVEIRNDQNEVDRSIWDGEVTLAADDPNITVTPDRIPLINGRGSGMLTIEGEDAFQLIATWTNQTVSKAIDYLGNQPITELEGDLAGENLEWSGVIRLTGDVTVPDGSELNIHPGTWVFIEGVDSGADGTKIIVNGSVNAAGDSQNPIIFTANNPEQPWGEILHMNSGISQYEYAFFNFSGRSPGAGHTGAGPLFRVDNSAINFKNCYMTDNAGKIMYSVGGNLEFRDCIMARSVMGPEILETALFAENTWFTEMLGPDDNDGVYLHTQSEGQEVRLSRCVVARCDDDGVDQLGAIINIDDCIIRDVADKGISLNGGEGFIDTCIIVNNSIGVSLKVAGAAQITRSTIVCRNRGIAAEDKFGQPDAFLPYTVSNSIIHATLAPENSIYTDYNPEDIMITFSDVGETWPGNGNFVADPLFLDSNKDFHLHPLSPCINAGDPELASDPDGTRADIGALRFAIPQNEIYLMDAKAVGKWELEFILVAPPQETYVVQTTSDFQTWNDGNEIHLADRPMSFRYQSSIDDNLTFIRVRKMMKQ